MLLLATLRLLWRLANHPPQYADEMPAWQRGAAHGLHWLLYILMFAVPLSGYFYSLAAGFLTGKYRKAEDASKSPRGAKTTQLYLNDRGLRILAALEQVSARVAAPMGEVAVAWVMRQPAIASPIASASNLEQLQSLIRASQLQLDADAMATLNAASAEA